VLFRERERVYWICVCADEVVRACGI